MCFAIKAAEAIRRCLPEKPRQPSDQEDVVDSDSEQLEH
jgi:hypothetical protein